MTYALWIVQGLLALLFLFTGGMKLVLPLEVLTGQTPLAAGAVRANIYEVIASEVIVRRNRYGRRRQRTNSPAGT